ncbi:MAG: hypothetical protein LBQ67_06490 [Treponema sp.]|jgi:hypothetical protein|nr:hypothetical protein [Treponema sp.]
MAQKTKNTGGDFGPYDKSVHSFGFWSTIVIIFALMSAPFLIQAAFDLDIDTKATLITLASALSVFGPIAICEFLSYAPILGAGGLYLSFVTGNIMNMKIPAAKNSQKICGLEPGTPEADAVSTLAVAVSSIVTTVILLLGMLLTVYLLPVLQQPLFKPAFDNLIPAIFGALAIPVFLKNPKTASLPCGVAIAATLIFSYSVIMSPLRQTYLLPGSLVLSVLWAYFLYRRQPAS